MDQIKSYFASFPAFSPWNARPALAVRARLSYIAGMNRAAVLQRLRAHESELKALGVARLSLFGSVARDDAGAASDVDLAAELDRTRSTGLFHYGRIANRLEELLGTRVDLATEPARKARLQAEIDRDRVRVF